MSGLGKRGSAGGTVGSLQGVLGGERVYAADMLARPLSGWPVSADAPLTFDAQSQTKNARSFDSDADRAVAFSVRVPDGVTSIMLRIPGRVGTPQPGEVQVLLRMHARVGEGAWEGPQAVGILKCPNNLPQSTCYSVLLSALGISPGDDAQFLLSRNPSGASDTLDGGWLLYELGVNFA